MQSIKVLIVDDKKIIGDLFEFILGYHGHTIVVVDNAKTAIEEIQKHAFDVAFLDIVMPNKDGVELLFELRKIAPQLPVIMMSGYSVEDKKNKAKELGAITCLKKPFEIDDVRHAIKKATGKEI